MTTHHGVLLTGVTKEGFVVYPKKRPPIEFEELVRAHSPRLRVLLDSAILRVGWNDGDCEASVTVIPIQPGKPHEKFQTFRLPFPGAR
jgi:hypothetical protein